MKRFLLASIVFVAVFLSMLHFGGYSLESLPKIFSYFPCAKPITYRVDAVDPKFNLTKEDFTKIIGDAATLWNIASGKTIFAYDADGKVSVNLTYDGRQGISSQINELETDLKDERTTIEAKHQYYEQKGKEFENRVAKLNEEISYWNSQSGAPPEEYEKLKQEQQALRLIAEELNQLASQLNQNANEYNSEVGKLNQTIDVFNDALNTKPEEGIYDPNEKRIDIFFSSNQQTLKRTAAHELGHARGIGHIEGNQQAIMYPRSTMYNEITTDDLMMLTEICRERSVVELIQKNVKNVLQQLQARIRN